MRSLYEKTKRLAEIKDGGATIVKYQYDPFGKRISKTANGETIWFQYGDEGLVAEYNSSTPTKLYGWQPQGLRGTEPLWQADISGSQKTVRYYHVDNLGTSQRLTDKDGEQVWAMQSEVFGKITIPMEVSVENNLRFPGQYFDSETDLHYNYFRDYNPSVGRYIQSDPVGLEGGFSIMLYVEGNPITRSDSEGLRIIGPPKPPTGWIPVPPGWIPSPRPPIPPPSSPNGNYWGVHDPDQDMKCTIPFVGEAVDKCYIEYQCTASSWIGNLGGYDFSCQKCNRGAVSCFMSSGFSQCCQ
jgi:RHS repeat-associated protein